MKFISSLILTIVLSGCAVVGESFEKVETFSPDTATLYVMREWNSGSPLFCTDIYIYGKSKGCLRSNGFMRIEAKPGTVYFRTDYISKSKYKTLELNAGDVLFIEWQYHNTSKTENIIIHSEGRGIEIIKGLKG